MDQELLLLTMLEAGLSHCTVVLKENGNLLVSLFVAGLLGSATHCLGMCGPFVLSQVTTRYETMDSRSLSEFKRISGAALLPYHFGRLTTYIFLGLCAGLLAQGVIHFSQMPAISAGLLLMGGLFFLGYGLKRFAIAFPKLPLIGAARASHSPWAQKFAGLFKPLFAKPEGWRGYLLGIGLGFLPCGLLYGALAVAGASGDYLAGAFAMMAFALGTIPSLFAVGLAGHMAGQKWRNLVTELAPVLLIANAGVLFYLSWSVLA